VWRLFQSPSRSAFIGHAFTAVQPD